MLSKELEILKHIKELYSEDISEDAFESEMSGKETMTKAWKEAFDCYSLRDVLNAIDEYFVKRNNRTPPRIPQITAILKVNNVEEEIEPEKQAKGEVYLPDLDVLYMNEDVESGDCHHNLYYYTEALRRIRANEYPFMRDVENPSKSELTEIMEELCEKRTGNKREFLSRNDLISQGYDANKRYSVSDLTKTMFKRF